MPNNLIKSENSVIQPARFEELDAESAQIIRAKERSNRATSPSDTPSFARNVLRKEIADLKADPVDLFQEWPPPSSPRSAPSTVGGSVERLEANEIDGAKHAEGELREEIRTEFEAGWQARLDQAVEEAKREGYGQGYAEARRNLEQEFDEDRRQYREGLQRLRDTWGSFINRSETLLLEIAIEIAQFLVDVPLPERFSKLTEDALIEALEGLALDVPIRLSLNPVDLMRLQETGMARFIEEQFPTLRWDPQAMLKEGNWIVQTPRQAIRRVSEELIDSLRDRFGLDSYSQEQEQRTLLPLEQHIPPVTNISVTTTTMPPAFRDRLSSTVLSSPTTVSSTAIKPDALDMS